MNAREQTFDEMAAEVHREFASHPRNQKQIADNPLCQICGLGSTVSINRWGPIKAACRECLDEELRRFEEQTRIQTCKFCGESDDHCDC